MLDLPESGNRWVAIDTEGSGFHPDDGARVSVVSLAWAGDDGTIEVRAYPFDQGMRDKLPNQTPSMFDADVNLGQAEWDELGTWAFKQNLIMHNASHDVAVVRAGTRFWPGMELAPALAWDTMLAEWVLEPLEAKGLDKVAERRLGRRKDDEQLKKSLKALPVGYRKRYDLVRWEEMEQYARVDAELTFLVYLQQLAEFKADHELWALFEREMDLCRTIIGMCRRGMGYDVVGSLHEATKANAMVTRLRAALPFEATPNGARRWFYGTLGEIPHCVTPKKAEPSVRECCVRVLVQAGVKGAADFERYQKVRHAVDKYYRGFVEKCGDDGRLRTDLRQTGTVSMRFSSQRVNLQALPHDYKLELVEGCASVRSLFRPKPGHVLWEMDAAQAELRVGAKLAKCTKMLRSFVAGDDIHAITAHDLFKVEYGAADFFEYRQVAKRSNFSLIYDVGPNTFRATVEKYLGIVLAQDEAERIVYGWRQLYPEFPYVNRKAEMRARANGYVTLKSGRKRWFGPMEDLHKAFNQAVQGNIAEGFKLWMVELDDEWPETLLMQVHDSLIVELPEKEAPDIVPLIQKQGAELLTTLYRVPMVIEAKVFK